MSIQPTSDAVTGKGDENRTRSEEGELTQRDADALEPISKDDVFHLLQNGRRRSALRYIMDRPDQDVYEMRDIAEQVAAWENDKPVSQISSAERQRVYIALYQSHLPKLDEKDVIDYNQNRGTVTPTEHLPDVSVYLRLGSEAADAGTGSESEPVAEPQSTPVSDDGAVASGSTSTDHSLFYYSGATAFGLLLTGASWAGVIPAQLSPYLGLVITCLFGAIALTIGTSVGDLF